MTLREMLDQEIDVMGAEEQAELLDFARHLRVMKSNLRTLEQQFDRALAETQHTGRELGITDEDIAQEIQAVRREAGKRP